MFSQIVGCSLLGLASDLSDHNDSLGGRVLDEQLQAVDEVCAVKGVSTNTDTESLAQANSAGLMNSFVGESARPGDDSNTARLVDVAGHDTNLAGAGGDDAGTVRTDQTRFALSQQSVLNLHHILLGNPCTVNN